MTIVLFEDQRVTQLYPVTTGKPAFAISCGSYRLIDLIATLGHAVRTLVRPHLREVLQAEATAAETTAGGAQEPVVYVNARLVPSVENMQAIRAVLRAGRPGIVQGDHGVALVLLAPDSPPPPADSSAQQIDSYLSLLQAEPLDVELPLLNYSHDIVQFHLATLRGSLEHRLKQGGYEEIADGVFAARGARLGQYVVCDTTSGPIVLEQNASIGPYCYLRGPIHVGRGARVIEHAALKDSVCLAHTTKVGGEVEGSIIEAYTNKQHHGFLGHSYLGSWVNLGAGTCNSDLKNTYGKINMEYFGRKVPTGMQFFGCIVGDYAKTAINTGIFTGKTVGTCSMVYGFVTTNVPSFVNYARSFGQTTEVPVEVVVAAQGRMFARRNVPQRPCDIQLLHDMHDLTRHERQIAGEPLSL